MVTGKTFWTLTFELLGQNIAPLHFKTERVVKTAFRASLFWPTWARFPGTWGIISSPGDSKLSPKDLGFQSNGQSKSFWTFTFEFFGRNIAPLNVKTERVSETVLRASWFWATLAGFPGTWEIFCRAGYSKLPRDGHGFQRIGNKWNDRTFRSQLLGGNIARLNFKTERVVETALRAYWFSATLAGFPGTWGIFSRPGDSKITRDALALQRNGHR